MTLHCLELEDPRPENCFVWEIVFATNFEVAEEPFELLLWREVLLCLWLSSVFIRLSSLNLRIVRRMNP